MRRPSNPSAWLSALLAAVIMSCSGLSVTVDEGLLEDLPPGARATVMAADNAVRAAQNRIDAFHRETVELKRELESVEAEVERAEDRLDEAGADTRRYLSRRH